MTDHRPDQTVADAGDPLVAVADLGRQLGELLLEKRALKTRIEAQAAEIARLRSALKGLISYTKQLELLAYDEPAGRGEEHAAMAEARAALDPTSDEKGQP